MATNQITQIQARKIAFAIISEIKGYIIEHHDQYMEFIKKLPESKK